MNIKKVNQSSMVSYMEIFRAMNPDQTTDVVENYKLTLLSLQLSEQQRQISARVNNNSNIHESMLSKIFAIVRRFLNLFLVKTKGFFQTDKLMKKINIPFYQRHCRKQ